MKQPKKPKRTKYRPTFRKPVIGGIAVNYYEPALMIKIKKQTLKERFMNFILFEGGFDD